MIPLDDITELYIQKKWPIKMIAAHLCVSRQAIEYRLRQTGIKLKKRRLVDLRLTDDNLRELYCDKEMTMIEIGKQFNVSSYYVSNRLRQLSIPRRRSGRLRKHASVRSLEIGEHFMIEVPVDREPPSSIYSEAKKIGIRIVIRRLDDQTMMVKRTQLLTPIPFARCVLQE
jgi:predicted DNA-binding protein YlxM (UPF0122 family)